MEDPREPDVGELLACHLDFARATTPREGVHALPADGLLDPAITLFGLRSEGELLAIGALRWWGEREAELKSMHTAARARGRGLARELLLHLIEVARGRGVVRLSLETGSFDAFAPARALYASAGFVPCGPFADYAASPTSAFLTLVLADPAN